MLALPGFVCCCTGVSSIVEPFPEGNVLFDGAYCAAPHHCWTARANEGVRTTAGARISISPIPSKLCRSRDSSLPVFSGIQGCQGVLWSPGCCAGGFSGIDLAWLIG